MEVGSRLVNSFLNKTISIVFLFGLIIHSVIAQDLKINEVQSSNVSTIYDHRGDTPDWIEIYNAGTEVIDLAGYGLSDVDSLPLKWTFPTTEILPDNHILVFASGLNLREPTLYWETIFDVGEEWKYIVPQASVSDGWRNTGFDDSQWLDGKCGFGYGDNDDSTVLDKTISVFIRREFSVSDKSKFTQAYLHIDFDDAFVAYLNGVEIARSNIGVVGIAPSYDTPADNADHEARMYQGGEPEDYLIEGLNEFLVDGANVLAIQAHNHSLNSSDLSVIPIFTLGSTSKPVYEFSTSPYVDFVPIGLHTNFKISSEGEPIILSDPNGLQIDSVFTNVISPDISLGRKPDGSNEWVFFAEPTPGLPNTTEGFLPDAVSAVQFSNPGGMYQNTLSLELTSSGATDSIFYTIDGSEPTKDGAWYQTAIPITTTMTVRARVIKSGYLPGVIATHSYLMNKSHDLPVVFISTDPENLWDEDYGIYVMGKNASYEYPYFGANFWEDWERPANITMYEPDGTKAFQLDAGIKIFGAWSRGQDQKSLSIHTRKSYGYDGIYYKIFKEKDIDEFKTVILRNSGNDFNNTMLRDAFCNRIVSDRDLDQQAYRPAVLYLNGEYWGIQNIREKVNEEFLASNHGIEEDNIDILENSGVVVRGSSDHYEALIDYINTHNLSDDDNYNYVKTQIDIENFIQYQVAQIFIDNRDWPGNNIKFWRERKGSSRWKWILYDLDFGLNTWDSNNQSFNTLQYALEPNGPDWPNPPWSTLLFRKLVTNTSFKHDFINAFADNLNTIFLPSALKDTLNEMIDVVKGEVPAHFSRWNADYGYWNNRISAMRLFINERRGYVQTQIRTVFGLSGWYNVTMDVEGNGHVNLNTLSLKEFPWKGLYYKNVPVEIEAVPDPGYRFVEWKGLDTSAGEKLALSEIDDVTLTAVFEPIDEAYKNIVINEINYNSSEVFDVGDWVELLNAGDYAVNISGWVLKDSDDAHEYMFPEGTVIYAHEYLVICRNINKFKVEFPLVDIVEQELSFGLGSGGDCVRLFADDNLLIDEVCYENDSPWPIEANGLGATLALENAYSNNNHPENWVASLNSGTPGAKNTDVITGLAPDYFSGNTGVKIYPNPLKQEATIEITSQLSENIELSIIDMTGRNFFLVHNYPIQSGINSVEISDLTLAPGLYVLQIRSENIHDSHQIIIER